MNQRPNLISPLILTTSLESCNFRPCRSHNRVHAMADEYDLDHFSRGAGKKRFITIQRKSHEANDEWQLWGYIGLMGSSVDKCAETNLTPIPSAAIRNRVKRDGPMYHITLFNPREVTAASQALIKHKSNFSSIPASSWVKNATETLLNVLSLEIVDDWVDKGLGSVSSKQNQAWYRIIEWPSAQAFRKKLGFEAKDFHITIGYLTNDIHDVRKDVSTLVQ
eukprot:TRINITY_DN3308_c0_g1_i1.p1 TRINITY_DN3308_c0_g1~~TRINITY_DN3308_c0_g1_i1.p1  ORF type:complete len:221 (-),score=30.29 TRINITY_DN3308_c0_g1_i1:36-698(-)